LSFGEGRVEADRVREILGLVGEEVHAEVLRLVADRDAAATFLLVDRLLDHGVDLVQFIGGLGDLLRALLLTQLGVEPPDLTDRMRENLARARERLAAEDAVRMLKLLTDTEAAVRRSASPRLAVETLLLRWTLMDRVVDLERVIAGETPRVDRRADGRTDRGTDGQTDSERTPASPTSVGDRPSVRPSISPSVSPSFTLEGVQALWPELVEVGRGDSRFLGEALAACHLIAVEPPEVRLRISTEQGILAPPLERGRVTVERYLAERLGQQVRLVLVTGVPAAGEERPKRLSESEMRAERLHGLRGVDPALDAAVDELDLEIVDELPPRP
jgi:DNA polymerase-3 subunit gamma/tau